MLEPVAHPTGFLTTQFPHDPTTCRFFVAASVFCLACLDVGHAARSAVQRAFRPGAAQGSGVRLKSSRQSLFQRRPWTCNSKTEPPWSSEPAWATSSDLTRATRPESVYDGGCFGDWRRQRGPVRGPDGPRSGVQCDAAGVGPARVARRQFGPHPQFALHARCAARRVGRRLPGRGVLARPAEGHRRLD